MKRTPKFMICRSSIALNDGEKNASDTASISNWSGFCMMASPPSNCGCSIQYLPSASACGTTAPLDRSFDHSSSREFSSPPVQGT